MKNLNVQAYRGLLMIWIVLFHYTARITQLYPDYTFPVQFSNGGEVGVMYFFALSGFFFFKGIEKYERLGVVSTAKFALNKYWRLWTPYIISLIIIFAILRIFELPGRVPAIKNFLIDSIFLYHPHADYIDSAHWFLASLCLIQIVSALFLLIDRSKRDVVILAFEIILFGALLVNSVTHDAITGQITSILCARSFLMFLIGYNIFKHTWPSIITGCALVAYFAITISPLWVTIHAIITIFVLYSSIQIPHLKALHTAGNYSFPWYLIHQNIGYLLIIALYDNGCTNELFLLVPIAATFILSVGIHHCSTLFPAKLLNFKR